MVECLLEGLLLTVHTWYNMEILGTLRSVMIFVKSIETVGLNWTLIRSLLSGLLKQ